MILASAVWSKGTLRNARMLALCSLTALSLSACSRKLYFARSALAPAAEGQVRIKTDQNNNYHIQLRVRHLAPSNQLTPPKATYVVWMVTDGQGTKNIGQLQSSGHLFSKTLKASLNTVSAFMPKGFFITGEDHPATKDPGTPIVLQTR